MTKDIKNLLKQKLAENTTRHVNAQQSTHLDVRPELKRLALDKIRPNPFQPRMDFDEQDIASLAESIKEMGLLQPVTVRETAKETYELVAGERRFRAHQLLNRTQIDAIVIQANDSELAILALAENASRQELCDFEIGQALHQIEQHFPNRSRLAEAVGLDRKDMYRYLAYADLPPFFVDKLRGMPKLLSRTAAYELKQTLSRLELVPQQTEQILNEAWNRLASGELEQSKLSEFVEAQSVQVTLDVIVPTSINQPDLRPIMVNGKPVGKFHHKGKKYVVELNAAMLDPLRREELERFIEQLLSQPNPTDS